MKPDEWWKNFALGMEVDVAGAFIYNGIKSLHDLPSFHHPIDIFEILYNISVGVERLLKVAVILLEHDAQCDIQDLEKSLITHNTIELARRVSRHNPLNLSGVHYEFLSLLSHFYKSIRYNRFSLNSVPNISEEKERLLDFLKKHIHIDVSRDEFIPTQNTNQIRKFIGRTTKAITDKVFCIIQKRARELNIYTDELRADSKALKVFYGERLDFIDEEIKKKEMLLFLMSNKSDGPHKELMQSIEALDMDPNMLPNYIQAILNDRHLPFIDEIVDELYAEIDNVKDRLELVSLFDNEHLSYGCDDEDEGQV